MNQNQSAKTEICNYFVQAIIKRIKKDNACLAAFRRADNPSTEHQSWEYLASFNIDLSKSYIRLPYATIAAAIAKSEPQNNGTVGIGRAIAKCYIDGNQSDQAKAKLRRLLACDSLEEACRILRPLFCLINAKTTVAINFIGLLRELLNFHRDNQSVKSRWAQDFYGCSIEEDEK